MRAWTFPLALESGADTPLFVHISQAIARDIARGRLRPAMRCRAPARWPRRWACTAARSSPPTPSWRPGLGPRPSGRRDARRGRVARHAAPVRGAREPSGARADCACRFHGRSLRRSPLSHCRASARCDLALGRRARLRLFPVDLLDARLPAVGQALRPHAARLRQRSARPRPAARRGRAMVSAVRGLPAEIRIRLLITRGSQMALDLVGAIARSRPGDVVAVEALGYAPAFNVFRRAGPRSCRSPSTITASTWARWRRWRAARRCGWSTSRRTTSTRRR